MIAKTVLAPIVVDGEEFADLGYCRTKSGGIHGDGPVIHTFYCRLGDGWSDTAVSGSDCISPGQNGAAIKAKRDADAERLKFTPPEFRAWPTAPGPAIRVRADQRSEVVVLRGRPHTPDNSGEWTTWREFTEPWPNDFRGSLRRQIEGAEPQNISPDEATKIVSEYAERLPHYEFRIVRARLSVHEDLIA
jgi:hypothetical protein